MAAISVNAGTSDALQQASLIPIAQLAPSLPTASSKSVKTVVTLTWPYSSITGSVSFLLAEPDFRLRNTKGQVRVHFSGPSAKAVTEAGIASGDEIILSLDGAEWIKDDKPSATPGRAIEFELKFKERLLLQFIDAESKNAHIIDIDHPQFEPDPQPVVEERPSETESVPQTPEVNGAISRTPVEASDEWESPAFIKRARESYGSLFDQGYDPFAEEDGTVRGRGRKRTRLSSSWRYASRSPSSEVEGRDVEAHIDSAVVLRSDEEHTPLPTATTMDEGCQTIELEGDVSSSSLIDPSRGASHLDLESGRERGEDLVEEPRHLDKDLELETAGSKAFPSPAQLVVGDTEVAVKGQDISEISRTREARVGEPLHATLGDSHPLPSIATEGQVQLVNSDEESWQQHPLSSDDTMERPPADQPGFYDTNPASLSDTFVASQHPLFHANSQHSDHIPEHRQHHWQNIAVESSQTGILHSPEHILRGSEDRVITRPNDNYVENQGTIVSQEISRFTEMAHRNEVWDVNSRIQEHADLSEPIDEAPDPVPLTHDIPGSDANPISGSFAKPSPHVVELIGDGSGEDNDQMQAQTDMSESTFENRQALYNRLHADQSEYEEEQYSDEEAEEEHEGRGELDDGPYDEEVYSDEDTDKAAQQGDEEVDEREECEEEEEEWEGEVEEEWEAEVEEREGEEEYDDEVVEEEWEAEVEEREGEEEYDDEVVEEEDDVEVDEEEEEYDEQDEATLDEDQDSRKDMAKLEFSAQREPVIIDLLSSEDEADDDVEADDDGEADDDSAAEGEANTEIGRVNEYKSRIMEPEAPAEEQEEGENDFEEKRDIDEESLDRRDSHILPERQKLGENSRNEEDESGASRSDQIGVEISDAESQEDVSMEEMSNVSAVLGQGSTTFQSSQRTSDQTTSDLPPEQQNYDSTNDLVDPSLLVPQLDGTSEESNPNSPSPAINHIAGADTGPQFHDLSQGHNTGLSTKAEKPQLLTPADTQQSEQQSHQELQMTSQSSTPHEKAEDTQPLEITEESSSKYSAGITSHATSPVPLVPQSEQAQQTIGIQDQPDDKPAFSGSDPKALDPEQADVKIIEPKEDNSAEASSEKSPILSVAKVTLAKVRPSKTATQPVQIEGSINEPQLDEIKPEELPVDDPSIQLLVEQDLAADAQDKGTGEQSPVKVAQTPLGDGGYPTGMYLQEAVSEQLHEEESNRGSQLEELSKDQPDLVDTALMKHEFTTQADNKKIREEPERTEDTIEVVEPIRPDPTTPARNTRSAKHSRQHSGRSDRSDSLFLDKQTTPPGYDASMELAESTLVSPSKSQGVQSPERLLKHQLTKSLRTELSEFTALKQLRLHLNKKLDVLAIATTTPPEPQRAKGGPRQYLVTFNVTDPSIAPSGVTQVQVFRPYKEALPLVQAGDGILLRNFQVVSVKGRGFALRSEPSEASSWAVFKKENEVETRGPPVEYGKLEKDHIAAMKAWYHGLDSVATAKLNKANGEK